MNSAAPSMMLTKSAPGRRRPENSGCFDASPVRAVLIWLERADIQEGAIFRPLNRHGQLTGDRLSDRAIVMHPLPRGDELPPELDGDPRIACFRQAKRGLAVRMALLCLLSP